MSSLSKSTVEEGDQVILFESVNSMTLVTVERDGMTENRCGVFLHNDILDRPFGSRVFSTKGDGWMAVMRPFPDMLPLARRIRTQIIQPLDANVIGFGLNLSNGKVVVEAGTGSGIMSLFLLRMVAPKGHLFTFEFNKLRADIVRQELERSEFSQQVTASHGDVCSQGFGDGLVADHSVDAVFLDVPRPWEAVEEARRVLRPGGRICLYSPCIEQVMRGVESLQAHGFYEIEMKEAREREFETKRTFPPEISLKPVSKVVSGQEGEETVDTFEIDFTPLYEEEEEEGEEEEDLGRVRKKRRHLHPTGLMRGHTAFLTFATQPPSFCLGGDAVASSEEGGGGN